MNVLTVHIHGQRFPQSSADYVIIWGVIDCPCAINSRAMEFTWDVGSNWILLSPQMKSIIAVPPSLRFDAGEAYRVIRDSKTSKLKTGQ